MSFLLPLLFTLAAASPALQQPSTCVEFTLEKSTENTNSWDAFRRFEAKPFSLDSPTPAEFESILTSPLTQYRMNSLFSMRAKAVSANLSVRASRVETAFLPDPPFNAVGRLFVADGVDDRTCTAFFVAPALVMTAAHCVYDRGKQAFYSNMTFTRVSDRIGGEEFSIAKVGIVAEWITSATPHDFDYAFLRMSSSLNAVHPLTLVQTPASPTAWIAIGYPADPPFRGITMMRASGSAGTPYGHMIMMVGNPMQHGTSGGPWSPPATPQNGLFGTEVISLGSIIGPEANTLYGPIIDDKVTTLMTNVRDVTGDCKQ